MKIAVLITGLTFLLFSCGNSTRTDGNDSEQLSLTKSYIPKLDSQYAAPPLKVFQITYHDELYAVSLTEKDVGTDEPWDQQLIIRLVAVKTGDTLLTKTVSGNAYYEIENPAKDCYWLPIMLSGYGSGITGDLYRISFSPKVSIDSMLEFHEFTAWLPNASVDTLLVCTGLWDIMYDTTIDPNTDKFEGHYDPHVDEVRLYKMEREKLILLSCDTTKNKYDLVDNPDSRYDFEKQEKALLRKLKWKNFSKGPVYPQDIH